MILVIIKELSFSDYKRSFKELLRDLYYRNMTVDGAEKKLNEFDGVLSALSLYSAKKKNILKQKINFQITQKNFKGIEEIIEGFKNGIFPLNHDEREGQEFRDKEEENTIRNENGLIHYKKLERLINLKNRCKQ